MSVTTAEEIELENMTENGDIAIGSKMFASAASEPFLAALLEFNTGAVRGNATKKADIEGFSNTLYAKLNEINLSGKETVDAFLRLIGHNRDIESGKGERLIAYCMIRYLLAKEKIAEAKHITSVLVTHKNHYGSWRDVDTLYDYLLKNGTLVGEFNRFLLDLVATQLRRDQELVATGLGVPNKVSRIFSYLPKYGASKSKYDEILGNGAELEEVSRAMSSWTDSERSKFKSIKISLCGKWQNIRSNFGNELAKHMFSKVPDFKSQEKNLRQLLSSLRKVLLVTECLMSSQLYGTIEPSSVPAKAMLRYKKVFQSYEIMSKKNDLQGRNLFRHKLEQLLSGKTDKKIKTSGLQFYELLKTYVDGGAKDPVIEVQAKEIVLQFQKLVEESKFPICVGLVDVSGSMSGVPMVVSVSLGILLANIMPMHWNQLITFHETPSWVSVNTSSSFHNQVRSLMEAPWGGSTNVVKALQMVREKAMNRSSCLPEAFIIFTDMQYDSCGDKSKTSLQFVKQDYEAVGLKFPKVICWNLRASDTRALPASADESGVCLVSGFSQALFKAFVNGLDFDKFTPLTVFKEILYSERYAPCEFP